GTAVKGGVWGCTSKFGLHVYSAVVAFACSKYSYCTEEGISWRFCPDAPNASATAALSAPGPVLPTIIRKRMMSPIWYNGGSKLLGGSIMHFLINARASASSTSNVARAVAFCKNVSITGQSIPGPAVPYGPVPPPPPSPLPAAPCAW